MHIKTIVSIVDKSGEKTRGKSNYRSIELTVDSTPGKDIPRYITIDVPPRLYPQVEDVEAGDQAHVALTIGSQKLFPSKTGGNMVSYNNLKLIELRKL